VVERTTLPGDRRSFYRITVTAWPELLARRLRAIDRFVELADQGLVLLEHEAPARRTRLVVMRRAHVQLQRALQTALAELRREAEIPTHTGARPRTRAPKRARKP
jgi:hypothetical protein